MEKYDLVVRGKMVREDQVTLGQIGVKDGKIAVIESPDAVLVADKVLDFANAYVFPGTIDVHVHCFSNPNEGFIPTSMSAAAGGITTFLDMPYDLPNPISNVEIFEKR